MEETNEGVTLRELISEDIPAYSNSVRDRLGCQRREVHGAQAAARVSRDNVSCDQWGDYRRWIFTNPRIRLAFEACLFDACGRSGCLLQAFGIMGNHFPLAAETPQGNLVAGMQWLQSTFRTALTGCALSAVIFSKAVTKAS